MPKRIDAEGQFDYAASAQLASGLTLRFPADRVCAISIPSVDHPTCASHIEKEPAIKRILVSSLSRVRTEPEGCWHV